MRSILVDLQRDADVLKAQLNSYMQTDIKKFINIPPIVLWLQFRKIHPRFIFKSNPQSTQALE